MTYVNIGIAKRSLCQSEVSPSGKNKASYLYLVEGERLKFAEIRARVPDTIKSATLYQRLGKRFESTWEYLSESVESSKARNNIAAREKMISRAKRRDEHAKARHLHFKALRNGHKELT